MKKYIILIVLGVLLWSCGKDSDLGFDQSDRFKQISSDTVKINPDTVGIHSFLADKYVRLLAKEQRLLYYAKEKGIYSFVPVALPESDNVSKEIYPVEIQKVMFDCSNNNFFFGYPTAIDLGNGKPLVVAERRVSEKIINDYSDGIFISQDNSKDWGATDFFKYAPYGNSFMSSQPLIAKDGNGKFVVKSAVGVLVSNGSLDHWTHFPRAFDALNSNGKTYVSLGFNLTYSSKFGLFFGTGHSKITGTTNIESAIFKINSDNGEATEVKTDWVPPLVKNGLPSVIQEVGGPVFYSVEKGQDPDLSQYDGYVVAFCVNKDKLYQFVYSYNQNDTWDDVTFVGAQTTIQGSLSRQSTPQIFYNPNVKRFEMIHSTPYELALYSMSVDSLLNNKLNIYGRAEWKKEATLLNRDVIVRGQGMHPVSSIIDKDKNVQRVYIDMGDEYPGRCGVFELTRTLNTKELATFVRKKRAFIATQPY